MSYTVLARKYRPQVFADLAGQEHVSRTLANAIAAGRVAHAFLFTGARGVGKTTTARLLAKALNCEQGPTAEPCNQCSPCREITAGNDLDVLEIDGASNNSVDDVRRLQESLPFRPARDRFKVVIVDEVHMLSGGAFNAFLKTLEEPPEHVKFIFATTEIHKVPITIRSRCQRHDFRLIPRTVVAARVKEILAKENITADEEAVSIVVREADGSLRDALTVLDQLLAFGGQAELKGAEVARGLGIADRRHVLQVAEAMLAGDAATCVRNVGALADQGLDIVHFARQLLGWMRDLVVLRVVGDSPDLVDRSDEERQQAAEIAQAHSAQHLERSFAGLSKLLEEVFQSADPQLTLEMGLVRLADRPPLEPLAELLSRLQALEQRLTGPGGGTPSPGRESGGPGGGGAGGAGRGPRRPPAQVQAPHELRPPARLEPRRGGPERRESEPGSPEVPVPRGSEPPVSRAVGPGSTTAPATAPAAVRAAQPTAGDPGAAAEDGIPGRWRSVLEALRERQPALGAVLEHAAPLEVGPAKFVLGFAEGSFHGRQAASELTRQALGEAAERILGAKPEIEIRFGTWTQASLAGQESTRRQQRRDAMRDAALSHPAVKDAMDVFPEAEGHVDVQTEEP